MNVSSHDFESCASANSATPAYKLKVFMIFDFISLRFILLYYADLSIRFVYTIIKL